MIDRLRIDGNASVVLDTHRELYAAMLRYMRVQDRKLARILRDAAIDADRLIQAALPKENIGALIRRAQYQQSALELRRLQASLWGEVGAVTRDGIERAAGLSVEGDQMILSMLARAGADPDLLAGMREAARRSAENVRSRYLNDIQLSERVYKNRDLALARVDRIVNRGIALNKSAREIAQEVRGLIRPDTPGGVSYAAKRLARTELNNAFHTTTVRIESDRPWVLGYKWNLSRSHPRTDSCDALAEGSSGRGWPTGTYDKNEAPFRPHPNCLCFLTVATVTPERFVDDLLSGRYARAGIAA